VGCPRLGTVSPWASKASDIARNCGFAVQRIERLIEYRIATSQPLSQQQVQALQAQLHDRMTETVFLELHQAQALFQALPAQELHFVDLQTQGRAALEQANTDWRFGLGRR
jgi:phosphoribosylformylglycinamidine synthase